MRKIFKTILCSLFVLLICLATVPFGGFGLIAEAVEYKVGDIIQFGSYPQREVKDEVLIAELNALAPEWEDWTSYGYYSGTGSFGTMVQGDWMKFIDINYGQNKYRGVSFAQYRQYYTYYDSAMNKSYQDDNGYNINTIYWFAFEEINWRVLDPIKGLVMCETIIDAQPFCSTIYRKDGASYAYRYFNDISYKKYASDYATSSIRKWLNEDFYRTAFSENEMTKIGVTTLNNDSYYIQNGESVYTGLDSEETNDKIFLLSYSDIINTNYGFNAKTTYDATKRVQGSDYAKSQGLCVASNLGNNYLGNSHWLLRTPGNESGHCGFVDFTGSCDSDRDVESAYNGIRPALTFIDINNFSHNHNYEPIVTTQPTHVIEGVMTFACVCGDNYTESIAVIPHLYKSIVTAPTCTSKGYTTYTCECGDFYIDDYIVAKDHSYILELTKAPTHIETGVKTYTCTCGDSYTEAIEKILEHTYKASKITEPTCENAGYTTYICECGESRNDNFVPEKGHSYSGQMCTACGKNCSCNCHKSGFMGFIWKIILFFNKLFKTNRECACGIAHF